jgi:hypothetical protein
MHILEQARNALFSHGYQPTSIKNNKITSMCPAHNDTPENPNLDTKYKNGKILFNCRSRGCNYKDIISAIGLKDQDLFDNSYEKTNKTHKQNTKTKQDTTKKVENKQKKIEVFVENPYSTKVEIRDLAHYAELQGSTEEVFKAAGYSNSTYVLYDDNNRVIRSIKYKTDSGWCHRILDNSVKRRYRREKDAKQCFFMMYECLDLAFRQGQFPVMCNGESSTVVSQSRGLPAFNLCANENSDIEQWLINELVLMFKDYKLELKLLMLLDNDDTGRHGALKRKASLEKVGFTVTVLLFNNNYKGYDLANFCKEWINASPDLLYQEIMALPMYIEPVKEETKKDAQKLDTIDLREDLPRITTNRQLVDILPNAIDVMATMNDPPIVFRQSDRLIRINEELKPDTFFIQKVKESIISGMLFRGANWVIPRNNGNDTNVQPLAAIVNDIIVNPPDSIPDLESIISAPSFTFEDKIFNSPGYNKNLKAYYPKSRVIKMEKINPNPTESEVVESLQFLETDLFSGFPFDSIADYANALATLLEQFIKFQIYGCRPMRAFEAATPGTGKTLLARAICLISFGREVSMIAVPEDKKEWPKLITSLLMEMPEAIFFDNVKYLHSMDLEAALTALYWKQRILGENTTIECVNRALWIATGNNIVYGGDLPRRIVPIRIVANQEDPSKRPETDFKHADLLGWVNTNRSLLVHSCLTIIQYWINQGKPLSKYRLGSFESWSTNMGGLLDCIGVKGFLVNLEKIQRNADPNRDYWIQLVTIWYSLYRNNPTKIKDLVHICETENLFVFSSDEEIKESSRIKKLSGLLKTCRDKIFGQYKIIYNPSDSGHPTYQLEYIENRK